MSRVECKDISVFNQDGQRTSIPHFVPYWLVDGKDRENFALKTNVVSTFPSFFESYKRSFHCPLADAMFGVLLGLILEEAENKTSDEILLSLVHDIATECNLKRHQQIRQSRQRSLTTDKVISLVGSVAGCMIADARLLSFVAKVAYEIATTSHAEALRGMNSDLGYSILETVMTIRGYRWKDFFFKSIMRVSGEGNLFVLLDNECSVNKQSRIVLSLQPNNINDFGMILWIRDKPKAL